MKIVEKGYSSFRHRCNKCGCLFEYELIDIDDEDYVTCPWCGIKCIHKRYEGIFSPELKGDTK